MRVPGQHGGLFEILDGTGPIIRREKIYEFMDLAERRKIFNKMVAFFRQVDIRYKCFSIEKKHIDDAVIASAQLPFYCNISLLAV